MCSNTKPNLTMAPPLQGHTLGQRQKFYNELVNKAMDRNIPDIPKINFEDSDVDNMIRIDVACKRRNIEYILNVFKCDDMLYVSRAIKKSTWLITEPQYAHIINPKHLHSELFPQMNAKAVTKLMLHIRRHLKNEVRVKAFYEYINERNPKAALRWLGNCPLQFIENVIAYPEAEIPLKLLRRLCIKSFDILVKYLRKNKDSRSHFCIINKTIFFLKNKLTMKQFLRIIIEEAKELSGFYVNLKKYTHLIMKTCPETIKAHFIPFYKYIDVTTFVKYIKTDEIRSFLTTTTSAYRYYSIYKIYNEKWNNFETLAPFFEKLPRAEVLDFLCDFYRVNVDSDRSNKNGTSYIEELINAMEGTSYEYDASRALRVCRWYRFVPFDIAFSDLKRFVCAQSASEDRHFIMIVLLTCARYDSEHLKTVIQYYHDKHINEPYLHKKTFIDSLLSHYHTFRFDDSMWNTLNALFHSSEVYIESDNEVQASLISIIVRDVINDRLVHKVVEEKFEIETLKHIKSKLSFDEQDKLFNYLYNLLVKRINVLNTGSETGMRKAIELLQTMWTLIKDWDRVDTHYRFVIDKTDELCDVDKASSWIRETKKSPCRNRKNTHDNFTRPNLFQKTIQTSQFIDLASVYKMIKSCRKYLFEKSLLCHASEEVLLNALKHDPGLLARYKTETDFLRSNDGISLNRFLSKLRIYWSESLAPEWIEANTNLLYLKKNSGHRALVRGILTLLPHNKALDFIKMHTPDENKVLRSEANEIEASIQKHIAKNMHIARPQLPVEVVLWYARGDYLQYVLMTLCTIYNNVRSSDVRNCITLMLNAPVSLQKHGIRSAFVIYNMDEKLEIATKLWKKTNNLSIRAILFTSVFNLFCDEKEPMAIKAIWLVMSSFIDDLNDTENKIIYKTMGNICSVPLSIVGEFYQKAYLYLKSLPEKVIVRQILENMFKEAKKFIEYFDSEFVEEALLGSMSDIIFNHHEHCNRTYIEILSAYLLCSKDRNIQMQRYTNLIQPLIDKCEPEWVNGRIYFLEEIQTLLGHICSRIPFIFRDEMPIEILSSIRDALLKGSLSIKVHYVMIRRLQLIVRYIEALDEIKKSDKQYYHWSDILTASTWHIASMCQEIISEDQHTFFPSIYLLFKEVLNNFFHDFDIQEIDLLKILYEMLSNKDCPLMYMLVLDMVPRYGHGELKHWVTKIENKILSHPSEEVTMHYFKIFGDKVI